MLLALRDNAKNELMQIKSVEDGMRHLNKLKSIETWVRAEQMDAELQNLVAEQKLRTQRILGALIKAGQEAGEIATQESGMNQHGHPTEEHPRTLQEIGISRKQSSAFKAISDIPEDKFEAFIQEKKDAVNDAVAELTTRGALKLAGRFKQSYEEDMRVTGYLNKAYAKNFRAFIHWKGMDMSEAVGLSVRGMIDALSPEDKSAMMQSYLSSLKMAD